MLGIPRFIFCRMLCSIGTHSMHMQLANPDAPTFQQMTAMEDPPHPSPQHITPLTPATSTISSTTHHTAELHQCPTFHTHQPTSYSHTIATTTAQLTPISSHCPTHTTDDQICGLQKALGSAEGVARSRNRSLYHARTGVLASLCLRLVIALWETMIDWT